MYLVSRVDVQDCFVRIHWAVAVVGQMIVEGIVPDTEVFRMVFREALQVFDAASAVVRPVAFQKEIPEASSVIRSEAFQEMFPEA